LKPSLAFPGNKNPVTGNNPTRTLKPAAHRQSYSI
jgi:hypothetical protein